MGIIVNFFRMIPKDRKYLIIGVAVVLLLGVAITVIVILLAMRSGKATATKGQQTTELKEPADPCVILFKEYEAAEKEGVKGEELKALYAKSAAECPSVFTLLQQEESPRVEDIRARLAQRLVEKKAEGVRVGESASQALASKGRISAAQKKLKEELANAKRECKEMIEGIYSLNGGWNLAYAFTEEQRERIDNLVKEGMFPSHFNGRLLVQKFWRNEMIKSMKAQDAQKAQHAHSESFLSLGCHSDPEDLVTNQDRYKFWTAIANDNWAEATRLSGESREKIKYLKELTDAQMDAWLEFDDWGVDLENHIHKYSFSGDEWEMSDLKAECEKIAEKMNLLREDIHRDFDDPLPALPEKKSLMQELDEQLDNKTPEFKAAFKKLREDRSLGMMLVIDAVKTLEDPKDRIALLKTVKELHFRKYRRESSDADYYLASLLLSAVIEGPTELELRMCFYEADLRNVQHLANIIAALEWIRSCGGDAYKLATLDLWILYATLVQSLTTRFDEKSQTENGTLIEDLRGMISITTPYDIRMLGNYLSRCGIGAEGLQLIEQCAVCSQKIFEMNPTDQIYKREHEFAQGYLAIYKSVNGANMKDKVEQVRALRNSVTASNLAHF